MFTTLGSKDIGVQIFEFLAKTQFLWAIVLTPNVAKIKKIYFFAEAKCFFYQGQIKITKMFVFDLLKFTHPAVLPLQPLHQVHGPVHLVTFKVVISVWVSFCLFVCWSDHNSATPGPICLKFWLGNLEDPWGCS